MKLEKASLTPPPTLEDFLADLGDGENGFSGTPVHSGEVPLQEYLRRCLSFENPPVTNSGLIPQTVFWVLDDADRVVGMVKVRRALSEHTMLNGGHIGFYIDSRERKKGHATRAVALALGELRKQGVNKALITVYPENAASIKVVETNGGRYADTVSAPGTGHAVNRYWVDLVG